MKKMYLIMLFLISMHITKCMQEEKEKSIIVTSKNLKTSPSLDRVKKQDQEQNKVAVEIFSKKPTLYYTNGFSHKK